MEALDVHYDEAYYAKLYALEAGNFWFRGRNRLLLWALDRFVGEAPRRYLEIGCGTGYVLSAVEARFPAWNILGSEVLEEGLAFARTRMQRAGLIQLDARQMPFSAELDAIGAFDVLEHIEDDELVLAKLREALKPGGRLVLTVPQHPFMWSAADDFAHHVRRYTAPELKAKLARAGFTIELMTSFVSLIFPAMAAARLGGPGKPEHYSIEKELSLPGWLNAAFERLLDLERGLIRAGLRFPFGGSLLVVAKNAE